MANRNHLNILNQGTDAWNRWRLDHPALSPNLRGADFSGDLHLSLADFRGADLCKANLSRARLRGAKLSNAILGGADLSGADLSGAYLSKAHLSGTNLSGADLCRADLCGADLCGANLTATNLSGAIVNKTNLSWAWAEHTIFANTDLSTTIGLETVMHLGPSTIGVDAVYLSKGKIPSVFLRGAGAPDNFIEYMHSLVGTAFEFYSCFISYSGRDQEFADRLYSDLQNNGVRCWFASHDVQTGKKLHEQIDSAIRLHERLLLILSPNSIESEWVKTEIANARMRESKEGKQVLFPIRLNISYAELQEWKYFDADRGKDSAREIREYFIPDFTRWKEHDIYKGEFDKLLRDLKKKDSAVAEAEPERPAQSV